MNNKTQNDSGATIENKSSQKAKREINDMLKQSIFPILVVITFFVVSFYVLPYLWVYSRDWAEIEKIKFIERLEEKTRIFIWLIVSCCFFMTNMVWMVTKWQIKKKEKQDLKNDIALHNGE